MNRVRVISGALKGRDIATPGHKTHPMGGREKLAIFNSIAADLPGAHVLDVFAGSGALAIEAISQGAASAILVESEPHAIATIKQNLANLHILDRARVTKTLPVGQTFSIIFADPPYQDPQYDLVARLPALLAPGGFLVFSHLKTLLPPPLALDLVSAKSYAAAAICIYRKPL
jgi:16S rRNA (guanine966-N2)-methyltransferase